VTSMYPGQEIASRFRAAVLPCLRGDSRELVDEWIDEVGEYGIAVGECLAVAAANRVSIDPDLIADARREGFSIPHQAGEAA